MEIEKKQRLPMIEQGLHKEFKIACTLMGLTFKEGAEIAIKDFLKKEEIKKGFDALEKR
jgi:hypothetical protein